MFADLCRHIKTNGLQCRGVAIANSPFCYFHRRLHDRHAVFHSETTRGFLIPGQHIELGPLEDRESVQLSLSCVINALATGQLETKRATALLYGLQLASANAARLNLEPDQRMALRELLPGSPDSEVPGLDLALPGAVTDLDVDEEPFGDGSEDVDWAEAEHEARLIQNMLDDLHARKQLATPTPQPTNSHQIPTPEPKRLPTQSQPQPATLPTLSACIDPIPDLNPPSALSAPIRENPRSSSRPSPRRHRAKSASSLSSPTQPCALSAPIRANPRSVFPPFFSAPKL